MPGTQLSQPNKFARPIPGQGLTDPFGAMPWQKPPMYVHLDQALEFVWERISLPQNVGQILALLSTKKLSAQDIADTILMQGFMNGQWTVTLGLMMAKPVWQMVAAIGHKAKIKFHSKTPKADPLIKMMQDIEMEQQKGAGNLLQGPPDPSQGAQTPPASPQEPPPDPNQAPQPPDAGAQPPAGGLMSPPSPTGAQ